MRRYPVIIVITLLVLLSVGLAIAQSDNVQPIPYVYRIDIKGCTFEPVNRRQTGFRVQGVAGIVTALHGVADCKTIHAAADGGQEMFTDLAIQQVDIERDVALLASAELEELPTDGLLTSPLSTAEILTATLRIVGYPRGLEKQDIDVIESIRDIESLDDVIPDAEEPADFIKRKSSSLTIEVLNVQAQLLPGHSGAPLIDSADQIVAIGNGGLRGGTEGRSWAIPWLAVDLQAVDLAEIQQKLAELAAKDIAALAFSSTYPSQVNDATELATYTVRVVDTNQTPIANAEVLLTHSAGYMIGITDSEGFYIFQLPTNVSYIQSQIQVEELGYPPYNRTLSNVLDKVGIEVLRLTALRLTPSPVPVSFCEFAFRILAEDSEEPIAKAELSVTFGRRLTMGKTDSNGFYESKLPCPDLLNVSIRVRVVAEGYMQHSEIVPLVGEVKEILLTQVSPPTPSPLPTSTQIATPTRSESRADPLPTNTSIPEEPKCSLEPGGIFYAMYHIHSKLLGCPISQQITVSTISEEIFQGGHLFWRKDTDIVYIIYDRQIEGGELFDGTWDKSIDKSIGRYWSWAQAGEPDPDGIGLSTPSGLIEPKRGFGWLWRTHLGGANGRLGWALDVAYGFDNIGQAQEFAQGLMFKGSDPKIYVLLVNGRFYAGQ